MLIPYSLKIGNLHGIDNHFLIVSVVLIMSFIRNLVSSSSLWAVHKQQKFEMDLWVDLISLLIGFNDPKQHSPFLSVGSGRTLKDLYASFTS